MRKLISVPFILLACIACFFSVSSLTYSAGLERDYQHQWCTERGGKMEVVMSDGTRADCVTDTHAIEFDFAPKWAEAIGQSMHYAILTKKKAGIVLIMGPTDTRFLERLLLTTHCKDIDVWTVVK